MPVAKPPVKLKAVTPFITRAHQIDKTDPVIAYWCYFWAVQIIITNQLHSGDSECTQYTTSLLDELEARKERLLPNDTITDDLAAQAYIENFANKVFTNADNALQARKVSRQTADTFLAAATFLELLKIFPDTDSEIINKIKFAKYQATRIIKAFQNGEDPNLPPATPSDDGQRKQAASSASPGPDTLSTVLPLPPAPPRPFVEHVEDEDLRPAPKIMYISSSPPSSHHAQPSPAQSAPTVFSYSVSPRAASPPVRSISPPTPPQRPQPTATDRYNDYFPQIPLGRSFSPLIRDNDSTSNTPQDIQSPFYQPGHPEPPPPAPPEHTLRPADDELRLWQASSPLSRSARTGTPSQFPPQHYDQRQSFSGGPGGSASPLPPQFIPPPASAPTLQQTGAGDGGPHGYYLNTPTQPQGYNSYYTSQPQPQRPVQVDEEAITKAQKHAKWAISALNYDDIPTAVKELRAALQTLGAS